MMQNLQTGPTIIGEGLMIMISNIFRSGSGQRSRQRSWPRQRPEPRQEHSVLDND